MSRDAIVIENIEEMRRQAGIDDVELREAVRRLRAGDSVRLTAKVATRPYPGEPLLVRITSVRGNVFRGRLSRTPPARLSTLKAGSLLTFTRDQIHSVATTPKDHT